MKYCSILLVLLCVLAVSVYGGDKKKKRHYEDKEPIPFYVNTVGPYANPTETYEYLKLPLLNYVL